MTLYGGIEGGGTKFVCAIGTGPDHIVAETTFSTSTDSTATIGEAIAFFGAHSQEQPLTAVGIASFGPVDPDPHSPHYG